MYFFLCLTLAPLSPGSVGVRTRELSLISPPSAPFHPPTSAGFSLFQLISVYCGSVIHHPDSMDSNFTYALVPSAVHLALVTEFSPRPPSLSPLLENLSHTQLGFGHSLFCFLERDPCTLFLCLSFITHQPTVGEHLTVSGVPSSRQGPLVSSPSCLLCGLRLPSSLTPALPSPSPCLLLLLVQWKSLDLGVGFRSKFWVCHCLLCGHSRLLERLGLIFAKCLAHSKCWVSGGQCDKKTLGLALLLALITLPRSSLQGVFLSLPSSQN